MDMRLPSRTAKVWMLYIKRVQCTGGRLSPNIIREVCSYLADSLFFPYLSQDKSRLFVLSPLDMQQRTCTSTPIMGKCFCMVDTAEIFYLAPGINKKSKTNRSYRMLLLTFQSYALGPMQETHFNPGVAYLQGNVYVFAGKTATCERLSLSTQKWNKIAYFPVKSTNLITCCHSEKVYLAGDGQCKIDIYNPVYNYFETIDLHFSIQNSFYICIIGSSFLNIGCYNTYQSLFSNGELSKDCIYKPFLSLFAGWTVRGESEDSTGWTTPTMWAGKVYVFKDLSGEFKSTAKRECMAVFDAGKCEIQIKNVHV